VTISYNDTKFAEITDKNKVQTGSSIRTLFADLLFVRLTSSSDNFLHEAEWDRSQRRIGYATLDSDSGTGFVRLCNFIRQF
jgi:hypothetical protein